MNLLKEIQRAESRIRSYVHITPLLPSNPLSRLSNGNVFLKLESEQHTGSFKARGALNKVLATAADEKENGFITASTGNHALGFARALSISGDKGLVVLPKNAVASKIGALKEYNIELEFRGTSCLESELYAKQKAKENDLVWVSPYNDPLVIAGQGTIGVEIAEQLKDVDAVLACVGGGGMIAGLATWLKNHNPNIQIIGCLPENAPEMYLSKQAGKVVALEEQLETLSDGSVGGLEDGSITFPLCMDLIDQYILVSEEEIASAIKLVYTEHGKIIEGSAGVAVGAFIKNAEQFADMNMVIVVCGGNIPEDKFNQIMSNI